MPKANSLFDMSHGDGMKTLCLHDYIVMRKPMKTDYSHRFKLPVFAAALFAAAAAAQANPIVYLSPSSPSVLAGDPLAVEVWVDKVPVGEDIAAFDLNVTYNSALLDPAGVAFDANLGDATLSEAMLSATGPDTRAGVVDFAELSLLSDAELLDLQSPMGRTFLLTTLNFTAKSDGTASFGLAFTPGNDVKCAANRVCVDSAAVPEPGGLWLFGLGLWLLGLGAKTRRNLRLVPAAALANPVSQ
jgi:hypothetical protein